jgi:hypothetical protein
VDSHDSIVHVRRALLLLLVLVLVLVRRSERVSVRISISESVHRFHRVQQRQHV